MKAAIVTLSTDSENQIPGLTFDTVLDGYIENAPDYKEMLDAAKTPEERQQVKNSIIEFYQTKGRALLEAEIIKIQLAYSNIVKGIKQVTDGVTTAIETMTVPASLTAAPNPASIILEAKSKKNVLLNNTDVLTKNLVELLQTAVNLNFILPAPVMDLVQAISILKSLIDSIPV